MTNHNSLIKVTQDSTKKTHVLYTKTVGQQKRNYMYIHNTEILCNWLLDNGQIQTVYLPKKNETSININRYPALSVSIC